MQSWSLTHMYLYSMPAGSCTFAQGDFANWTNLQRIWVQDNALSQAIVNEIVRGVYAIRTSIAYATPMMNIGGNNADPSGVYQSACPPTTELEMVYALVNDPCGDGHNLWTVTY